MAHLSALRARAHFDPGAQQQSPFPRGSCCLQSPIARLHPPRGEAGQWQAVASGAPASLARERAGSWSLRRGSGGAAAVAATAAGACDSGRRRRWWGWVLSFLLQAPAGGAAATADLAVTRRLPLA